MSNLYYPETITVSLGSKYNKLVREYCKNHNLPLSGFIKNAVVYYYEKIVEEKL